MDAAALLISRIIAKPQGITEAIDHGATKELFTVGDAEIFSWCLEYFKEFGSSPTEEALVAEHPEFRDRVHDGAEPTAYYVHELKKHFAFNQLLNISRDIATGLRGHKDPYDLLNDVIRRRVSDIDNLTSDSQDVDWASQQGREYRLRRYDQIKANQGKVGIITPFPSLNATFQLRKEGLYIIVARQGVGKTWLLSLMAVSYTHLTLPTTSRV